MAKLIKNWEELAQVPANDKYKIIVDEERCSGWIIPINDGPDEDTLADFTCNCEGAMRNKDYFKHHIYLSTHTFYGSQCKQSTEMLQKYGFDVELDNWDKEINND